MNAVRGRQPCCGNPARRIRSGNMAMISARSASVSRDQPPISFSVRPQPAHRLVIPSTAQTFRQGDEIVAEAGMSIAFVARPPRPVAQARHN